MIRFACEKCARPLEVDADLAGKQAACPHCWHVNAVPAVPTLPPGVAVARPVPEPRTASASQTAISSIDARAAALNLPPASGEETTICTVHPVMFRARPGIGAAVLTLIIGGGAGGVLAFMSAMIPIAAACGVAAGVGIIWAGAWKMHTLSVALTLTNKRAIERRGLLSRSTTEAVYDKIIDVEVRQTLWQRMTGVGTLGLDTAAEDGVEIEVQDLPDPKGLKKVIDAYRGM